MCDSWFLSWAPCPPFFVDNVYLMYITFARTQNLTDCEIDTIRENCRIEIPTTTTSTTTTATTMASTTQFMTTTTEPELTSTEERTITTFDPISTGTSTFVNSSTSFQSSTLELQTKTTTLSGILNVSDTSTDVIPVTNDSFTDNFTTFQPSGAPTVDLNNTVNLTKVPVYGSDEWCQGVCLIVASTTVACVAIVFLAIFAVLLRKLRDDGKGEHGRSRTRSRNRYSEVPNTELYDSVNLPSYSNRSSGSEMWHDTSDYSLRSVLRNDSSDYSIKEHTFVNPAFRRSFETPSRSSVFWYDPDAADPDYLQRNANLTRKSRSPDRKSPPKTILNNQKEIDKHRLRSRSANHVSMRDYVPKAVQYVDNLEQLPYQKCNGILKPESRHHQEKSPNNRSLPRTPFETSSNTSQESMSPHQRPSYRRSRSYDLDSPKHPKSRDEDGFYTVDTRHSRKHYVKNSQRNRQTGQGYRDRSVKGKLIRQSDSECEEILIMSSNLGQGQIHRLSNQSLDMSPNNRVFSSNLKPGSYKYRSQQSFPSRENEMDYRQKRSRSHKELRERSPNIQVKRGASVSNYYPLNPHQIYVFQTKL